MKIDTSEKGLEALIVAQKAGAPNAAWEKLSIFLNFLVPKLPAPKEEDLSKGILGAIDMDSYRVEKHAALSPADYDGLPSDDRPVRSGRPPGPDRSLRNDAS
jgi:type I restriction enzyme R subunit